MSHRRAVLHDMTDADRLVRGIAERQHALIARAQALGVGLTARMIQRRVESGRWAVVYEGVYRIAGTPDSVDQRRLAAVLAVGPDAAVSHRAAADVWGLWWSKPPIVEITTTRDRSPELDGV